MRGWCWFCQKSVTSDLPDGTVIRALMVCPECIDKKAVIIPDDDEADRARESADQEDR